MKVKTAVEYHIYFLLMLIATVLSAFIIPNPYMRAAGVCVFAVLCHLFGTHEGRLAERAHLAKQEQIKAEAAQAAQAAVTNDDEGHANDETFALKP